MSRKPRKVTVSLNPQSICIISFLRAKAEHDLGIPVSFDDAVNAVICSYIQCCDVGLGGDE